MREDHSFATDLFVCSRLDDDCEQLATKCKRSAEERWVVHRHHPQCQLDRVCSLHSLHMGSQRFFPLHSKKIRNCEANTFGNSVYSIKFPPLKVNGHNCFIANNRLTNSWDWWLHDKDQEPRVFPAFGAQYTFSLTDAVQDVPEYLVHFPTLERRVHSTVICYGAWT